MVKKRVFCSFDYDNDKNLKDLLIGQSKNPDSAFEVSDWSMKEAAPSWEEEAEGRIKRSDQVIIVLGDKTHSASGVKKEVEMTRDNNVSIFQLQPQQPQDKSPTPVANGGKVYNWTWDNLNKLLG